MLSILLQVKIQTWIFILQEVWSHEKTGWVLISREAQKCNNHLIIYNTLLIKAQVESGGQSIHQPTHYGVALCREKGKYILTYSFLHWQV